MVRRANVLTGVAIGVLLAGCGGSGATSTPPATQAPAASPAALPFADEMGGGTQASHGKAGTYQTRQFRPKLVFTVPDGWRTARLLGTFVGAGETAIGFALSDGTGEIVFTVPSSILPPAPGDAGSEVPADLIAALAADTHFVLGAPSPVTIGGVTGTQVDGTLKADVSVAPDSGYRFSDYLLVKPGNHVRFAVLKVSGAQLVVMTSSAPAAWDAFVKTADAIISSVRFAS